MGRRIVSWCSMRFELFIAARYLRAKRRQAVVGVVTAISVIGGAAGVASLIIALAITNGMRRGLQERLGGVTSSVGLMGGGGGGGRGLGGRRARRGRGGRVGGCVGGGWCGGGGGVAGG